MKSHSTYVHTLSDVDWRNFDYGTFNGQIHDGELIVPVHEKPGETHDSIVHRLRSVTYGNKRRSAAIVLERVMWIESFGTAVVSSEIHVYKLAGRKPELVGIIDVGTPVHEVRFDGATKIQVTSGESAEVQRFQLVGGEFEPLPR